MSARKVLVPFGGGDSLVAASTATITILQILAATNHPAEMFSFSIFGDSTDLDATPIPGEWLIQTTTGTMSAVTEALMDRGITHTIQLSATHTATAEPTASTILFPFQFAPSAGLVYTFPPGDELVINTAERIGLRLLTPAAAVNVNGAALCRE